MKYENDALSRWLIKHPEYHPVLILRPGIWRIFTGPFRVLPDFLIIGAGKCGTSSLYNYLIQHPNVYPAKFKELNYFGRRWTKWYRPNFPTIFLKYFVNKFRKEQFMTGEASPYYLINPHVAKQVKKKIPNVKIIILLRNPVDRTFSQYSQWQKTEFEPLSFEEAIKSEKIRTADEWKNYTDDKSISSRKHVRYAYLAGGIYYDQIKVWMDVFPREQIHIIKAEDFFSEPSKCVFQVLKFLGLKNYELDISKKHNAGKYEPMDSSIQEYLKNYFRPHNEKLYKLLGRDLNWDD